MQHLKSVAILMVVLAGALILSVMIPAAAQGDTSGTGYPANTITVTGNGSASGSPDIANLQIGVEIFDSDLSAAFSQANERIDTIINAVVEAGVAREDIRTMGLNVFVDRSMGPMGPATSSAAGEPGQPPETPPQNYVVSNQLRVTVRDISNAADVINVAVENGANNIYGLEFNIDDRTELEGEARVDAMADARARAEHLAEIAGVELGEVLMINEGFSGVPGPFPMAMSGIGGGGDGATVEPGQLSVSMSVTVTYAIAR